MSARTKFRKPRKYQGDESRRSRWLDAVNKLLAAGRITRGASVAASALARRSDPTCKKVWGHQQHHAKLAGCSVRQFQRNLAELENAGLVSVGRCEAKRMPDGRWARSGCNQYFFSVPTLVRKKNPWSHRSAKNGTYKPNPTDLRERTREPSSFSVEGCYRMPAPPPEHGPCDGTRWIIENDGTKHGRAIPCSCMNAAQ